MVSEWHDRQKRPVLNVKNQDSMPLYSKKKFAQLCGKQAAHVSTNIARGKLITTGDLIDTDIEENHELMNKWRMQENMEPLERETESKQPAQKTIDLSGPKEQTEPSPSKSEISALNKRKTLIEIEYKQSKTNETKLKNAKLRGELIPTNMVVDMFGMLGHQFQTQYEHGASELVAEITHKLKVSNELRGEIGEKLTELINKSHKTAIEDAKIAIRNVISAVSGAEMEVPEDDEKEED